jgi:hypothetical protein
MRRFGFDRLEAIGENRPATFDRIRQTPSKAATIAALQGTKSPL